MANKKLLLETEIPRAKDKIYFCGTSADGMITVCCSDMARGGRKKKGDKK